MTIGFQTIWDIPIAFLKGSLEHSEEHLTGLLVSMDKQV
jgi:hypothetical protein